jgi:hypothetical protein
MVFPSEEQEREEEFTPHEISATGAEPGDDFQAEKLGDETLKSGDALVEALEVVMQFRRHQAAGGNDLAPPHFGNKPAGIFLLNALQSIRPAQLDVILQMMPFAHVVELFSNFAEMLPYDVGLTSYCLLYLLSIHE